MSEIGKFIGWVALAAIVGALVWSGVKDHLKQRKIDKYTKTLDQWGYAAGQLGKPPDFYKFEETGRNLDWVDELAIMQGWQRGFDEFMAANKKTGGASE
jgi:hypothetical protein